MTIASFRNKRTERLAEGHRDKSLANDVGQRAYLKLQMLKAATSLSDLKVPPGNRLELLRGNRAGQHSIRVNGQWRICFVWRESAAHDVEFVDYH